MCPVRPDFIQLCQKLSFNYYLSKYIHTYEIKNFLQVHFSEWIAENISREFKIDEKTICATKILCF